MENKKLITLTITENEIYGWMSEKMDSYDIEEIDTFDKFVELIEVEEAEGWCMSDINLVEWVWLQGTWMSQFQKAYDKIIEEKKKEEGE